MHRTYHSRQHGFRRSVTVEVMAWYSSLCNLVCSISCLMTREDPTCRAAEYDTSDLRQVLAACEAAAEKVGEAGCRIRVSRVLCDVHEEATDLAHRLIDCRPYRRYKEWRDAEF